MVTSALQTEQDFTAALLKLELERATVVCWAVGVGGPSRSDTSQAGYSSAANILTRNNFVIKDLLMTGLVAVPFDCDEVVLIAPAVPLTATTTSRSEEHTSELQSHLNLVCRLLLEKKKEAREKIANVLRD